MPTNYNDNFQVNAPKALDNKSGLFKAGAWRPYNDLAEFQATQPIGAQYENQLFWVRSTTDATKADLYSLRKDKAPYKVLADVDLSDYYTQQQIDDLLDDKLSLSGGEMSGDIQFNDENADKGVSWSKNTDFARIYFDSTSDKNSKQIFKLGDNGYDSTNVTWSFVKNRSADPQPDVTVLEFGETKFQYLGKDVQLQQDNSLTTTAKEVVPAINELVEADVNLGNLISESTSKVSTIIIPTTGQSTATFSELSGQYIEFIVKSGIAYRVDTTANEEKKTVTFNSSTNTFTFEGLFFGESVWVSYRGIQGGSPLPYVYIEVDTYADMRTIATGSYFKKILVLADEKRSKTNSPYEYWPSGVRLWNGYIVDDDLNTSTGGDSPVNMNDLTTIAAAYALILG